MGEQRYTAVLGRNIAATETHAAWIVLTKQSKGGAVVKPQKIYTALVVTDLARSEDWYGKLLGRKADYRPMDRLVQWEIGPSGGLQLTSDETLGGAGAMSIVVDDVEAERRRLDGFGIALDDSFEGNYSTLATVRDPDGHLIVLATPPSPAYPPA